MDGQQRALFDELYQVYGMEVKRFIYTQARRDAQWTDDIFQNTWMGVWQGLPKLRETGAARAWVYAIARNEAKRYFSMVGIRMFADGNILPLGGADDGAGERHDAVSPDDPIDEGATAFPDALADADCLARLLGTLAEDDQQLVLLRYAYDMSMADIAELYGANYNTVKSRMRRALGQLRSEAARQGMA